MKPMNKMDGDVFARSVAQQISAGKDNHIIIAQEAIDLKDEAKQSAQAYWMMGWTWDEIESVLDDSEYPKNVVTYAMKETKEYARKILNEGPFAVLNSGQSVKLANGSVGILEEKYADYITLDIKDVGNVNVAADQLDIVATERLREAHAFRVKSADMMYKLSIDQLDHISVEQQTLDPVLESVDNALSTMASIKQRTDEVKREAAQIHSKWEANTPDWQPKSEEEKDFAQYTYVTLTGEDQLDSEITDLFHNKLGAVLASLHDELRKGAVATDENIIGFMQMIFPHVASDIEGHLYGIKQRNVRAREYVQQFAKFGKEQADWQKEAVQWAITSWENTKEFMEDWETSSVPRINIGIEAISEFLAGVDNQQITASVQKALQTI